jgi:hypothetical protein
MINNIPISGYIDALPMERMKVFVPTLRHRVGGYNVVTDRRYICQCAIAIYNNGIALHSHAPALLKMRKPNTMSIGIRTHTTSMNPHPAANIPLPALTMLSAFIVLPFHPAH